MENNQVNSTASRTVTLYSTLGGMKKVQTAAKNWGSLKPLVAQHYDLDNLQATENIGKTTLEHVEAKLPEGEFVLFLRPVKTKSGAIGVSRFDASGYDDEDGYEDGYEDEDGLNGREGWYGEGDGSEDEDIDDSPHQHDILRAINRAGLKLMHKAYGTGREWADIGIELFKAGMSYYRDIEEAEELAKERLAEQLRSIEDGFGSDGDEVPALSPEEQRLEEMLESLERGF